MGAAMLNSRFVSRAKQARFQPTQPFSNQFRQSDENQERKFLTIWFLSIYSTAQFVPMRDECLRVYAEENPGQFSAYGHTAMTNWPHPYPGVHWINDDEERAVIDVLRRGSLFRFYGPSEPKYVNEFEDRAKAFYTSRYALAVNSCTGALECALAALGVSPGDEVIVPAFMWVANVSAIVRSNAIPVLCEIDDTFTMDPVDLERRINARTKLIIPIHMAGGQCDMDAIMEIADRYGIPVLEDAAQSNGGELRGRKLGTIGAMGVFSLQLNKLITSGEGGLLITNDEGLAERAFAAHDMGLIRKNGHLSPPNQGNMVWGSGRRMSELTGALASVQMEKLPLILNKTRRSHDRILRLIADIPGIRLRRLIDPNGTNGSFILLILESHVKARDTVLRLTELGLPHVFRVAEYLLHVYSNIAPLVKKLPISPAGNPWSLLPCKGESYEYSKGACPRSDALFARAVIIPIASCLTPTQEEIAAEWIRKAVIGDH